MEEPVPVRKDEEADVHIWCEGETERMVALYTVSVGDRLLCRALPKDMAMVYLSEFLDELAGLED